MQSFFVITALLIFSHLQKMRPSKLCSVVCTLLLFWVFLFFIFRFLTPIVKLVCEGSFHGLL